MNYLVPQSANITWRLDHVAHLVRNLDDAVALYSGSFGLKLCSREVIESQNVQVAFLSHELNSESASTIELISPIKAEGALQKFLETKGPGLHHVAFRVPSISAELTRLKTDGFRLIDTVPRRGARNHFVAFIHPSACQGVLVELCSQVF